MHPRTLSLCALALSVAWPAAAADCPWDRSDGLEVQATMTRVVIDGEAHDVLGPRARARFRKLLHACDAPLDAVSAFRGWRANRRATNVAVGASFFTFGTTLVALPVTGFLAGHRRDQLVSALVEMPPVPSGSAPDAVVEAAPEPVGESAPPEPAAPPTVAAEPPVAAAEAPPEPEPEAEPEPAAPDFRRALWGMTMDEVRAVERAPFESAEDGRLYFRDTVEGVPAIVLYEFADDALVRGKYVSLAEHDAPVGHVNDYERLLDALSDTWGPPAEDERIWRTDTPTDDLGAAVAAGDLVLFASWDAPETEVVLALLEDAGAPTLAVEYHHKVPRP